MGKSEEEKRVARLRHEINAYRTALVTVSSSTLRLWIENQIASREALL